MFQNNRGSEIIRQKPAGFTLVELLVVITIIGILIALLLPAVQAARAAARRLQCQNNLRQVALAAAIHMDAKGQYPMGSYAANINQAQWGIPRQSWFPYLLPYIEGGNVLSNYNFDLGKNSKGKWTNYVNYFTANSDLPSAPTNVVVSTFLCPEDAGAKQGRFQWGYFSFGNYMPFFGGLILSRASPMVIKANERAAFGLSFGARSGDFKDGTSNTMIFSEYLRSTGEMRGMYGRDQRGMLWQSDEPGGGCLMTQLSPNSTTPDMFQPDYWCVHRPEDNQPCQEESDTIGTNHTAAARSRHTDGVHVAMGDGSVHFVSNSISLPVWQGMATLAGGETPAKLD